MIEQWEQKLMGKRVEGSMGFGTWIAGTLVNVIDLFAPYTIEKENGERSTFMCIRWQQDGQMYKSN